MKLLAHTFHENTRLGSRLMVQVLKRYQNVPAIHICVTNALLWGSISEQLSLK